MWKWLQSLIGKSAPAPAPSAPAEARRPEAPPDARKGDPATPPGADASKADPLDPAALAEYSTAEARPAAHEGRVAELAPRLREHFAKAGADLPAFPPLAAQIFGVIEHPDFDLNDLIQPIQRDAVAAAEVVRLANSSFFKAAAAVENIRDAVVRLGARETAQAVSAISVRTLYDLESKACHELFEPLWQRLWHQSTVSAFGAGWVAMRYRKGNMDRAFLGGMLHDIGKNFVLRSLSILATRQGFGEPLSDATLHALLEDLHVEFGASVAGSWKLPGPVAAILRDHHAAAPDPQKPELLVVRLVSGLIELRTNPLYRPSLPDEVRGSAEALGLTRPQLQALVTHLRELEKTTKAFVREG